MELDPVPASRGRLWGSPNFSRVPDAAVEGVDGVVDDGAVLAVVDELVDLRVGIVCKPGIAL